MLADLIAVETDNHILHSATGDEWLDRLVFAGGGHGCISDVWSSGRHVVKGGVHVRRRDIIGACRKAMERLREQV